VGLFKQLQPNEQESNQTGDQHQIRSGVIGRSLAFFLKSIDPKLRFSRKIGTRCGVLFMKFM